MITMRSRVETNLKLELGTGRQLGKQVVRIGAVSYLNSKPLIYGLSDSLGESALLSLAVPSQLALDLNSHSIDIGLIPVVEYFRTQNSKSFPMQRSRVEDRFGLFEFSSDASLRKSRRWHWTRVLGRVRH